MGEGAGSVRTLVVTRNRAVCTGALGDGDELRPETRSPSIQEVAEPRGTPKLWTGHRGCSGATSTACQGHGSPHPQEGQPRVT